MKLMFCKENREGRFFRDTEETTGYTEKAPPDTMHVWDEEAGDWVYHETPEPDPSDEGGNHG